MEEKSLFALKFENFQKAVNRQEGDWVPNALSSSGGSIFWSGKTAFDVAGNHQAYAEAMTAFLEETWMDVSVMNGFTTTPRLSQTFPTAENRLAKDGTLTHLQNPHMKADEYDQLIADPRAFIANVLLPRKYPELFASRDAAKAALKVFAEERVDNFIFQFAHTGKYMAEKYGVYSFVNAGDMINTPLDHLFDYFRGFRGTLTDLRRQPAKVKDALESIWQFREGRRVGGPYNAAAGYAFQPCHIPAYLSPKQYREYYWPYEKQLIEWIHRNGGKIYIILEGRWSNIWDCFLEVPKDSCVLHVDDDDFLEAYKLLGQHQILIGGLKLGETRLKTFEQMKDDVKRVIDTCAPGGGFIFGTDKGFVTPGDVNRTMIECMNFAHEYSSK